ncbi:MAG: extracellular solute-binding protein [Endomicrobiales bacterium]|nr:extracellular solute-binding protein [Endomicrobiales bacterium]
MKRLIGILATAVIFLPILSCSGKPKVKYDVVIWHWMTDRQGTFEKLADRYFNEKGVRVLFETYAPSDVYKDKVRAAAAGRLLPEIYSPLGDKRELASYINAGYIADLTGEMDKGWKKIFFEKSLMQNTYTEGNEWGVKPGVYGVPIDVNAMMFYYNKDLFSKAGLDPEKPPKTWKQFIETGVRLRQAGIQPFVSGFGEGWLIGVFAASYEWNLLGKAGLLNTIKGEIEYTDPRWIRIFGLFDEMRKNNLYASGIATMLNKDAERAFATGQAAIALNGSWAVNVYHSMNPKLNYAIMMPPKLEGAKYPVLISGGEGSSLNINPTSPNKDKAIAFLKWLTEKEQQSFLTQETRNIPSNRDAGSDLPPVLKEFSKSINSTFEPLQATEHWQVTNALNMGLQAIIIGEKTPGQIAEEIQKLKNSVEKKR